MATEKGGVGASKQVATGGSSGGARSDADGSKLILWTNLEPVTAFAPVLLQELARLEMLKAESQTLIERIRCCAQRNEQFRRDRLVPSAVDASSDRMHFVQALQDCANACFDNMQPLADYVRELATLEETVDKAQDTFLRQTMLYCVKPLQTFISEDYVRIQRQNEALIKARDVYDKERNKAKSVITPVPGASALGVPMDRKLADRRQKLLDMANVMAAMLEGLHQTQVKLVANVDCYVRAEAGFYQQIDDLTKRIKVPDHRKRWPES